MVASSATATRAWPRKWPVQGGEQGADFGQDVVGDFMDEVVAGVGDDAADDLGGGGLEGRKRDRANCPTVRYLPPFSTKRNLDGMQMYTAFSYV